MNFTDTASPAHSDRPVALTLAWLSLLAALCWLALLAGAIALAPGADTAPLPGERLPSYTAGQLGLVFALWAGMCTAVMLPLSTRATVLFARVVGRRGTRWPRLRTLLFVLGHLLVCTAFAVLIALLHWTLHDAGMLDETLAVRHGAAVGLVLVAAGVYQWLPAKHACLEHCRAPLPGLVAGWRDGFGSALWRGVVHARICLGCFGLLMLLPLVAGPGNPVALAAIVLLVPAEIRLEGGHWIACAGGLALLAWGTRLLFP